MKPLSQYLDIHTHNLSAGADAIICIAPGDIMRDDRSYSIGIHPWTDSVTDDDIARLRDLAHNSNVVAIGETGLDKLKGPDLTAQEQLMRQHIAVSETVGKPLIIHSVRTIDRIIALYKELRPRMPWIIHGFRGKPQQARQLLALGFHLSLGEHFNADTAAIIPADRLHTETDTSTLPIATIRKRILAHSSPTTK
jgi:TatD DNase family protein